ncbi:nicotinate phosphoribosyltransferase [Georgenia thermotolerans]|uniref:Nicotinate phosphoribosyltransferase n=1 Tax=Georgenia thermotolerans TaxID=527326 RepID=A0A7J5UML6_9MICO|nr:nicotinate phosphoribosyltransferase [Georgenia thermotolerans]KAE8763628.1 nicotinate phosphoribosyltransferase [Georgenia thermotolerans]
MPPASTALLTDMYELTMIEGALRSGTAQRRSVFEVFSRRLPGGRRYGVVAGTTRVLDAVEAFRFGPAEIDYLAGAGIVGDETLDFLREYRFRGSILGYGEGECYFPGSPILTVQGTFADAVVLETVILSILNHDSAVAASASRMTTAAHGRPCLEMGARRTHEWAAVGAARAAVVGGFVGTSVLEGGRSYGIRAIGTAAHSFTLVHDDEEAAFAAQVATMGPGTTLLVDTYDVPRGVARAVAAARAAGGELGAVRLDSGDLVAQAFTVRQQLDALGATSTKITVTSDLDEYAIAALGAAPVDSYGVGTKLVTGSGHPTAELVYKLVAREDATGRMEEVAKASASKASVGGLKVAGRMRDGAGRAVEELVVACGSVEQGLAELDRVGARPLQVELVRDGEIVEEHRGPGALAAAQRRHLASRAELPYDAWRLSEGEPGIPTRMIDVEKADEPEFMV